MIAKVELGFNLLVEDPVVLTDFERNVGWNVPIRILYICIEIPIFVSIVGKCNYMSFITNSAVLSSLQLISHWNIPKYSCSVDQVQETGTLYLLLSGQLVEGH